MNNIMLYLETMGTSSNAAIIAIGACYFEPATGVIGASFYQTISLEDAVKYGNMDASTVLWWMKQSEEAKQVFNKDQCLSLKDALSEFYDWIEQIEVQRARIIWGNGATFDNVILASAFQSAFQTVPWEHYNNRDVRTIVDLGRSILNFDPKRDMPFEGVKHNAMDDAIHQAKYVSAIYGRLALNANSKPLSAD